MHARLVHYAQLGVTETFIVLTALSLFLIAGALLPESPLFAWSYQLGYIYMRHGPTLMRPKWSWNEYRTWHRIWSGFVGAFGMILTVGVWLMAAQRGLAPG